MLKRSILISSAISIVYPPAVYANAQAQQSWSSGQQKLERYLKETDDVKILDANQKSISLTELIQNQKGDSPIVFHIADKNGDVVKIQEVPASVQGEVAYMLEKVTGENRMAVVRFSPSSKPEQIIAAIRDAQAVLMAPNDVGQTGKKDSSKRAIASISKVVPESNNGMVNWQCAKMKGKTLRGHDFEEWSTGMSLGPGGGLTPLFLAAPLVFMVLRMGKVNQKALMVGLGVVGGFFLLLGGFGMAVDHMSGCSQRNN